MVRFIGVWYYLKFVAITSLTRQDEPRDVADPWYTDDFESAYRDIEAGCKGLISSLTNKA